MVRAEVAHAEVDYEMRDDVERCATLLRSPDWVQRVAGAVGGLN
jgi:hypothetical protein